MENKYRIYVDFHNADRKGRVRLNTVGTFKDITNMNIRLKPELHVILHNDEDLETSGTIEFSDEEQIWVARIDWNEFK